MKKIIAIIFVFLIFNISFSSNYIEGELGRETQEQAQMIFEDLSQNEKQDLADKYTNGDVSKLEKNISDGKVGPITNAVLLYQGKSSNGGGESECKNGVKLNTDFPGLGKCIKQEESGTAFSTLMTKLMKLLVNITVSVALIAFIAAGIMMMVSGVSQSTAGKGKELIKKVVIGIILLGLSGIILHTLNPNFFKTSIDYQIIKKLKV